MWGLILDVLSWFLGRLLLVPPAQRKIAVSSWVLGYLDPTVCLLMLSHPYQNYYELLLPNQIFNQAHQANIFIGATIQGIDYKNDNLGFVRMEEEVWLWTKYVLRIKQLKYLKMSDNYTLPNHRNYPQKYLNLEELKHLQWGVHLPSSDHYDLETANIKKNTSLPESQSQPKKKPNHQSLQDTNQYFNEESQLNPIESGFKKMKNNQIQILKELKKEYEVLKNSSLDSRIILNKVTSESQSYEDSNFASQSDAQSSINSRNQSRHRKNDNKELKLVHLQKKQLQLMLSNSMKKIEQLLHSEIQLKKTIIQLRSKLEHNKISQSEHGLVVRKAKESQDLYYKNLQDYKRQNDNLRSKVKDLTLNIGNLEGSLSVKELQLKKKEERVRLLEEEINLHHNKYASLELDLKKLKMEYDLLEKSKNQQIFLLNKNKNHIEQLVLNEKNQTISKLKEQLQLKQQRYLLLVNKLNATHAQSLPKKQEEKEQGINFQRLILAIRQQKNQQNNESITLILSKLAEMQSKPDQQVISQITSLRQQLQQIKQVNNSNDRGKLASSQYESRIRELEQVIQEENIEKIYFMEDIKKLTKDYNLLKKDKEELGREVRELKGTIDRLEQDNRRYKNEIEMIKNINIDLTESQHQNKNLVVKLQHMNLREIQLSNMKEQANKRYDEYRLRQQQYEEEIRILKKKLVEQELKALKIQEESELKSKLVKMEHQSQVTRLLDDLEKTKKTHATDKNDLLREKIEIEKKLFEKTKDFDNLSDRHSVLSKEGEEIAKRLRLQQESTLKIEQSRHEHQISALLSKIESVNSANARILQQSQKYAVIEQQMLQLKHLMRMNRRITDAVDHLWQVKETEYSNINEILNTFK